MKKKVIFTALLCILALSCAFAGKTSFVAQISPYSLQTVPLADKTYVSSYGYGAKGGIRFDVGRNISLGADIEFGVYKFNEFDFDYNVFTGRLLFGYTYNINEKLFAQAEFGLGTEKKQTTEGSINSVGIDMYAGCGYVVSEQLTATLGIDIGAGFQKGNDSIATNFIFKTQLGVIVAL